MDIKKHLLEHLTYLNKYYGAEADRILGIFLVGSQNYNLDDEYSDVDSRAVYIPTLEEIAIMRKPINHIIQLENGEHIEVKDIRLIAHEWEKQNINSLEILFTQWYVLNCGFKVYSDWCKICAMREEIAHLDTKRAIDSMIGMARGYIRCAESSNSTLTSGKAKANVHRLINTILWYSNGYQFDAAIAMSDFERNLLLSYKRSNDHFSFEAERRKLDEFAKENERNVHDSAILNIAALVANIIRDANEE